MIENKKKELFILLILIPVMVFFVLQAVRTIGERSRRSAIQQETNALEIESGRQISTMTDQVPRLVTGLVRPMASPNPEESARKDISRQALVIKNWPRDPFLPPVSKILDDPLAKIRLQGIVRDSSGAAAIIGGKVYREGDSFRGILVKEINRDTVKLDKDGREILLRMRGKSD